MSIQDELLNLLSSVDGIGSGIDGDTLNGLDSTEYLLTSELANALSIASYTPISTPTILYPKYNISITQMECLFSEFDIHPAYNMEHLYTDIEISKTLDFSILEIENHNDPVNKTRYMLPTTLEEGYYFIRVRYKTKELMSHWSIPVRFKYQKNLFYIEPPTILNPSNVLYRSSILTTSPYQGDSKHTHTLWTFYTTEGKKVYTDTRSVNLTTYDLNNVPLDNEEDYIVGIRYFSGYQSSNETYMYFKYRDNQFTNGIHMLGWLLLPSDFSVVYMGNNNVSITGGQMGFSATMKYNYLYNIKTETLQPYVDLIEDTTGHGVISMDFYTAILLGGINNSNTYIQNMYKIDYANNTVNSIGEMPYPLAYMDLEKLDNDTYIVYGGKGLFPYIDYGDTVNNRPLPDQTRIIEQENNHTLLFYNASTNTWGEDRYFLHPILKQYGVSTGNYKITKIYPDNDICLLWWIDNSSSEFKGVLIDISDRSYQPYPYSYTLADYTPTYSTMYKGYDGVLINSSDLLIYYQSTNTNKVVRHTLFTNQFTPPTDIPTGGFTNPGIRKALFVKTNEVILFNNTEIGFLNNNTPIVLT